MRNDRVTAFYKTAAWKKCRAAYTKATAGLCEICLQKGIFSPAYIVHHKKHLTPDNIDDPSVSLNMDNLTSLCRECHFEEHRGEHAKGRETKQQIEYAFDENGYLVQVAPVQQK